MTIKNYQKGLQAEMIGKFYLRLKGYRIVGERFKTPVGEIDLIAKRGRVLVFVEVKSRRNLHDAAEAVHRQNQQRVKRAAELYLQRHMEYTGYALRFDALLLAPRVWPRHISNAW